MGTPSLKLNTYRWKLPEKWYQVARSLGKSPKKLKVKVGPTEMQYDAAFQYTFTFSSANQIDTSIPVGPSLQYPVGIADFDFVGTPGS